MTTGPRLAVTEGWDSVEAARRAPMPTRSPKRRRFRFSLNALAIQLSAFALSFTLVALLVVSGSQAAFVEESEALAAYVPVGDQATPSPEGRRPSRPAGPEIPAVPPVDPVDAPVAEELPEPVEEVELTDSDGGTAMFRDQILVPGAVLDRCIEVSYNGTENPGPVLLFAAPGTGGDLAPYLDLTVDMGIAAAGAFGGCGSFAAAEIVYEGTLADFAAAHVDFATGRATWSPTEVQERRVFRFRVTVQDVAAATGKSAAFGFTWRAEP